jgi:cell surface protein SprA
MYIQLGSFSEDIFKDGKQQFENGLPTTSQKVPTEQTVYGKISKFPPIVNGFDISERSKQDIGYDGLNTFYAENEKDEKSFFKDYLDVLSQSLATDKYTLVAADPSNDDYVSYRDSKFQSNGATVLERYKRYNMPEGNGGTQESANAIASTAYSLNPDQEDINSDKSLNELESYFNYTIPLKKTSDNKIAYDPNDPNNRITQERIVQRTGGDEVWYRFRIPINESDKKIGESG